MKTILKMLLVIVGIVILGSSFYLHTNTQRVETEKYTGDFVLKPYFERINGKEHIILRVNTKKEYGCSNYGIENETKKEDGVYKVIIGDIQKWNICATAIGPASVVVEIPVDMPTIDFEIHSDGRNDVYKITQEGENFIFKDNNSTFTKLQSSRVYIKPANYTSVYCFRYQYGCEVEEGVDELCPLVFDEIEKSSDKISIDTIDQELASTERVLNEQERFYKYKSSADDLKGLYEEFSNKPLPNGRTAECRPDSNLYYLKIESELLLENRSLCCGS